MPVGERRRAILDAICELWRGTPPLSKRSLRANASRRTASGGARRSRTDDILLAKQALYQLSYGPIPSRNSAKPRRAVIRYCPRLESSRAGRPGQTRTADLTLIRRTL